MVLTAGQTFDYIGARALLPSLPAARTLLADRGYDPDWLSNALVERDIQPCIPSRKCRKTPIPHEWLDQYIIETIEEAQDHATQWLWTYNNDRPNIGIGRITPAQKLKMAA